MIALSYVVLREDDARLRVAAGVLAVAVPGAVQLVIQDDWGWPFWTGGLLVTWLSAEQLRRYRALVAELEATRERLAEQAVHLERRRIAAELHDLVGHSLGVLLLHVTGARRRVADDPAGAEDALRRAESIGRAGLAEIRRSVATLRDETGRSLAPATTAADVPALVAATAAPVYGLPPLQRPAWTVAGVLVGAVAMTGIGLLIGCLVPSARAAQGVGLLAFFPSFLLGGGGPPPSALGDGVRSVANLLPLTHVTESIRDPWLGVGTGLGDLAVVLAFLAASALGWWRAVRL